MPAIKAWVRTFHPKNDHDMCKTFFLMICDYTRTNPFLANLLRSPRGDGFFEKSITMLHLALDKLVGEVVVTGENNGLTARIYPDQDVVAAKRTSFLGIRGLAAESLL